MTPPYTEVKAFVQGTLGCSCPDEVFDRITVDTGVGELSHQIRIGGRLLVSILDASRTADVSRAIASALREGVRERDRDHFNRLRLVVISPNPDRIAETAQAAFSGSPARDERTHLHVLETCNLRFG
ncbi:MAG TPA: hypothetical protein VK855_02705 [Thioalkalivibrio sp.]|nr:hypothetical protein [Thioalkalivibrio sp.]